MIRNKRTGLVFGLLELAAAFQAWQIWVGAFSYSSDDQIGQLLQSNTSLLSIWLLLLPLDRYYSPGKTAECNPVI